MGLGYAVFMAETGLPNLDAAEQRVLGCLLEKQITVPATYPLSLNALRAACNQTSSREPVVDYDDRTVEDTARALKSRGLVRVVWAERGSRTLKYHQLLEDTLALQPDERALVTVLLLRGAQAPGELKTRTERLHAFSGRDEVEACLQRMAARPAPLVRELERRPGQQDRRWTHLLGPLPIEAATVALEPSGTREGVLAAGAAARDARVLAAYDLVAAEYAADLGDRLADQPFERWLLSRLAGLAGSGPVADVGCGPGQVAAFLGEEGAAVTGFDISPAMVAQARDRHPGLDFQVADFRGLLRPRTGPSWTAITGWGAFAHLAPSELGETVQALARVLAPDGWLAFSIDTGDGVRHLDQWWGIPVDLDVVEHDSRQVVSTLATAGFADLEWYLRGTDASGRATTLYVLARRGVAA